MTKKQTLLWTACPDGVTRADSHGVQQLKLSAFVSPRLVAAALARGGVLEDFADFQDVVSGTNWADNIAAMHFKVQFYIPATRTVAAKILTYDYDTGVRWTSAAEPDLFGQFFGPAMQLTDHVPRDFSLSAVKTFNTASVFSPLKRQYKAVAATPGLTYKVPSVLKLVSAPAISSLPMATVVPTQVLQASAGLRSLAAAPTQNLAYQQFEQFHSPFEVPADFVAPDPPIDFHKALAWLGNYPALMRRLGLIIDLQVPYVAALAYAKRVRVIPVWADGRGAVKTINSPVGGAALEVRRDVAQWTVLDMALSSTLPKRVTRFMAASRDGHVKTGYLVTRSITNPSADPVRLYNIDTDVAAARFIGASVTAADIMNPVVNPVGPSAAEGQVSASAVSAQASTEKMGLPSLGQPVIRMTVNGLAARMTTGFARANTREGKLAQALDVSLNPALFEDDSATFNYAEDLTRGYRVDVWDGVTRQWHRLCGRVGAYSFGGSPLTWPAETDPAKLQDEGWVQLGGVSAPGDVLSDSAPSEMRIHESVFDWSGWSLAVIRPGLAISEPDADGNSTVTDTFERGGTTHELGHYVHPDLPLDVRFNVPAGDLPRLRFGTTYRFRARAVDLAGNSVPFSKGTVSADPGGSGDSNPLVTRAIVHKRYEPVKSPTIVPAAAAKPSESDHILVVRTYHEPRAGTVVTENSARHITPPRIAINMAEAEGGLEDAATPGRPMDANLWATLCSRDAYDPPMLADGSAAPQETVPSPTPYLPDRYARGASLKGLPGVASSTTTRVLSTSARVSGVKLPTSSSSSTTVAAMRVSFEKTGQPWYDRFPFKVQVNGVEGVDARLAVHTTPTLPAWDEAVRVMTLQLPKADEYSVQVSSYLNAADLKVMGVHQWGMEQFVPSLSTILTPAIAGLTASAVSSNPVPTAISSSLPTAANAAISAASIGQNWMLTPPQELKLVHAVDQPMIDPGFTTRAHFERKPGETHATLVDWMPIHGKSTAKVDVHAAWKQNVDDPDAGMPKWGDTAVSKEAPVFSLTVPRTETTTLGFGKPLPSMVSNAWGKQPSAGMIVNDGKTDTKRQRFHVGDTKHHLVSVDATFTSRYEKYFSDMPSLSFTRSSGIRNLHIPSCARPAAPVLAYIVPTFGWTEPLYEPAGTKSSGRAGGGLRVYLERPWFSSGENERLAVVMYQPRAYDAGYSRLQPLVTQWGNDPLWKSLGYLPSARPQLSSFVHEARNATGLKLREYTGSPVMVAAYDVDYDPEFGMWYADIVINQGKAYFPFVKLSLARYQQYSLSGYELSSVVVADFVQLTPGRSASVTASAAFGGGHNIRATLTGQTYNAGFAANGPKVTMQLEKRTAGDDADTGWIAVGVETPMSMLGRTVHEVVTADTRRTWNGTVKLLTQESRTEYRIVIREYERYQQMGTSGLADRLVYADTVGVSFPSTVM